MSTIVKIDCDLVAGSIDGITGFFEQLAVGPNDVVLDLLNVDAIDGSGLGALLHVFKRKRAQGASFAIVNVGGQPERLLNELKVLPLLQYKGDATGIETNRRQATLSTSALPKLNGTSAITIR